MEFLGSETLGGLFAMGRSRRADGPQLDGSERSHLKGVLKTKGRLALGDVEKEIGNAYKRALDVKLIDIFLGAWSSISEIAAFGDTSKYPPGERHFVPLANHRISSSHRPKVELLIDGVPLVTLPLDVALQAQFEGAVLEVDGGHIHAAKPGKCWATASVACRGVSLASVNSRQLAFPGAIKLKPPFAIAAITGAAVRVDKKNTMTLSGLDEQGRLIEFQATPKLDDSESIWLIGRRPDRANFILAHRLVSGEHARIRFSRARGMEICDLDSSNGTRLNGRPIGRDYVSMANARKVAFGGFEMDVSHG